MTTTERTEKASAEENPLKLSLQEAFFTGRYRGGVRRLDRKQEYAEKIRRKRM